MSKEELMKLADSFQKKADTAFENYQETGMSRYGNSYRRNEELAGALRMAAGAADEHNAYIHMKSQVSNFAWRAKTASAADTEEKRSELAEALIRDLVAFGRLMGLIGGE